MQQQNRNKKASWQHYGPRVLFALAGLPAAAQLLLSAKASATWLAVVTAAFLAGIVWILFGSRRSRPQESGGPVLLSIPMKPTVATRWGGWFLLLLAGGLGLVTFARQFSADLSPVELVSPLLMAAVGWGMIMLHPCLHVREEGIRVVPFQNDGPWKRELSPSALTARWDQIDRYYWREQPGSDLLVVKVCSHQPGRVDLTLTFPFAQISPDERQRLEELLSQHAPACAPVPQ